MELTNSRKISFVPAITFLCLEVLAFVAFSLANSFLLYAILASVLSIIFVIIYFNEIKKFQVSSFAYFLFPLFMYGLLSALSPFAKYDLSIVDTIFIPIALIAFSFNGYMVANSEKFTIKNMMIVVYSALSIYALINLFITMVQFVPFYSFIYGDSYIYYDGAPSSVTLSRMAYALMGFSIREVSIAYYSMFPTMLLTSIIALFHISFKKDRKNFLIFLGFAVVGFLCLFLVPAEENILSDIVILAVIFIIALVSKGLFNKKALKISLITVGVIFVVGIIILFLNSQVWGFVQPLRNFIKSNSLLNRLFNTNPLVSKYIPILCELFTKNKLLGFPNGAELFIYLDGVDQISYLSGSWLMDNFMTSGIIGSVFFLVLLGVGISHLVKYFNLKNENMLDKSLLITFVVSFVIYSLFAYDGRPMIFYGNVMPIYTQGLFLITIFLIGYMSKRLEKEKKTEVVNNEKAEAL